MIETDVSSYDLNPDNNLQLPSPLVLLEMNMLKNFEFKQLGFNAIFYLFGLFTLGLNMCPQIIFSWQILPTIVTLPFLVFWQNGLCSWINFRYFQLIFIAVCRTVYEWQNKSSFQEFVSQPFYCFFHTETNSNIFEKCGLFSRPTSSIYL